MNNMNKNFVNFEDYNNQTMVFFCSWKHTLKTMTDKEYRETVEALFDYGMDGIYPDINKLTPVQYVFLGNAIPVIDSASKRYDKAKAGGSKGGRSKAADDDEVMLYKAQGMSNKDIAKMLGCSPSSIDRIVRKNANNNYIENITPSPKIKDDDVDVDDECVAPPSHHTNGVGGAPHQNLDVDVDRVNWIT